MQGVLVVVFGFRRHHVLVNKKVAYRDGSAQRPTGLD